MATSVEDLAARVERLERLQERGMQRTPTDGRVDELARRVWAAIPFSAWLKISGPTFAVMALGFTALWNAQQATTQRIMDLQQSTTQQIMDLQESTTERILEVERSTTEKILQVQDRILELQQSTTDRILEMQQQMLDQQREG